jgi:hypothetical protein
VEPAPGFAQGRVLRSNNVKAMKDNGIEKFREFHIPAQFLGCQLALVDRTIGGHRSAGAAAAGAAADGHAARFNPARPDLYDLLAFWFL